MSYEGHIINKKQIFAVHGRNEKIRKSMFDLLRAFKLEPIEWEQAITMTGKPNPHIDEILFTGMQNAQAMLIIFTPDDLAMLNPKFHKENDQQWEKNLTGQPRPNVIFEAGMGYGKDPDRTILIQIGEIRPFSDISGRHVLKFKGTPSDRNNLANRLRLAGCEVNTEGSDWLTIGDFIIEENTSNPRMIEKKSNQINQPEQTTVQRLLEELVDIFVRLYRSRAGSASIFAKTIYNSMMMQRYFGITIKEPIQGQNIESQPIMFLYKQFRLTPSNAYLGFDEERTNNFGKILDKDSAPDTIKDRLLRFFGHIKKFVKIEFNIELEFTNELREKINQI